MQLIDAEKSKSKKRVSFASDDQLAQIFYFEMDESERCTLRVVLVKHCVVETAGRTTP